MSGRDKLPIVLCPGCQVAMSVGLIEAVSGIDGMQEFTYRCPQCGTETKRQYSRLDLGEDRPKP